MQIQPSGGRPPKSPSPLPLQSPPGSRSKDAGLQDIAALLKSVCRLSLSNAEQLRLSQRSTTITLRGLQEIDGVKLFHALESSQRQPHETAGLSLGRSIYLLLDNCYRGDDIFESILDYDVFLGGIGDILLKGNARSGTWRSRGVVCIISLLPDSHVARTLWNCFTWKNFDEERICLEETRSSPTDAE